MKRRPLPLLVVVALALACFVWVAPTRAAACDMAPSTVDPKVALQRQLDEATFVAAVTITGGGELLGGNGARYEVRFTQTWKSVPEPHTTVSTIDTSCGTPRFDVGDELVIIAEAPTRDFTVPILGGHTPTSVAALLGPGATAATDPILFQRINGNVTQPPDAPEPRSVSGWLAPTVVGVLVTALIVGVFIARRHARRGARP